MNIESLIILILFLAVLTFLFFFIERFENRRAKEEKLRFREFVIALKAKDLQEYTTVIPEDVEEKTEQEQQDEYVDLDNVSPETLLKALKEK